MDADDVYFSKRLLAQAEAQSSTEDEVDTDAVYFSKRLLAQAQASNEDKWTLMLSIWQNIRGRTGRVC